MASKAKKKEIETQKKINRDAFNVSARKHGASQLPVPEGEKMPKVILKDLINDKRPKKI